MNATKIRLTRVSVSAIQVVTKMLEFVSGRSDMQVYEMTLETTQGERCRRVYINGRFGVLSPSIVFSTSFILDKDDCFNWILLSLREEITFNLSSGDFMPFGLKFYLKERGKFEICPAYEELFKSVRGKLK